MPQAVRAIRGLRSLACAVTTLVAIGVHDVHAAAWTPEKGGGTISVGYQYTHMFNHLDPDGKKISNVGAMDGRNVFLQANYGVTDQLAVNFYLPYTQKKFDGAENFRHKIQGADGVMQYSEEDNGDWHGEFQDFSFGAQYQASWGNWTLTPYAQFGYPSNDYQHFAHAAIGTNQKRYELGFQAARVLPAPLERVYLQFGYGQVWPEKFAHVDLTRSVATIEAGYFATDRLVLRAVAIGQKTYDGLDFPDDFAYTRGSRTQADIKLFNHHDQVQRIDFIEGVVGGAYLLSAETSVYASVLSTLWGENSTETKYSITLGVSRSF